jgi:hypothetical protein
VLVRHVGRALIDRGLGEGASLFAPDREVWSCGVVGELYELYNEHLDYDSGTFLSKLRGQVGEGSDEAKLLAAELLTLQALPLLNLRAAMKRERVGEVAGRRGQFRQVLVGGGSRSQTCASSHRSVGLAGSGPRHPRYADAA